MNMNGAIIAIAVNQNWKNIKAKDNKMTGIELNMFPKAVIHNITHLSKIFTLVIISFPLSLTSS